jgi:hypothetical protein
MSDFRDWLRDTFGDAWELFSDLLGLAAFIAVMTLWVWVATWLFG